MLSFFHRGGVCVDYLQINGEDFKFCGTGDTTATKLLIIDGNSWTVYLFSDSSIEGYFTIDYQLTSKSTKLN